MPNDTAGSHRHQLTAGPSGQLHPRKYTYTGDTNLDGKIDADDYARLDAAYAGAGGIGGPYRNGDIDYSGGVNSDDYFQIDRAYSTQSTPLAPTAQAPADAIAIRSTPKRHPRKRHHHHPRHTAQASPHVLLLPPSLRGSPR